MPAPRISRPSGRAARPRPPPALLVARERRARRLLDDLLMTTLIRAVADAERPHRALAVGHQLDLDVPSGAHEPLHQHAGVAERLGGLGACTLERGGELVRTIDAAHPAPAAARGGLDHQRVTDLLPLRERVLDALDGPAAPRCDRDAGLLGQPLCLDLVSERAHDVGIGADEHDPEPFAQLREAGMLGDEPPAHPGRVGLRCDERALELGVVQVGHRGAEAVRLVGLAHEQRVPLRLRVERDNADLIVALLVELAHGVDRTHRSLAAVDDREPVERMTLGAHPVSLPDLARLPPPDPLRTRRMAGAGVEAGVAGHHASGAKPRPHAARAHSCTVTASATGPPAAARRCCCCTASPTPRRRGSTSRRCWRSASR